MNRVAVIGVGLSKFGERWETSFRELAIEAGARALEDAGLEGKDVQALYGSCMASSSLIGQEHIGALLADQMGLNPIPATRIEAACASGGAALRMGYAAIASGLYDVVAVGGVEKMTEVLTEDVATALGGAGDQEWELFNGATFPALYALIAKRHAFEYGTTEEQMAVCAVKNHANAVHNPFAQYRREIAVGDVMKSGYVAEPLKLLDCSPITDGAAAAILCNASKAKEYVDTPIEIVASAQASDTLALASRSSLTELKATQVAAQQAYKQAGVQAKDVDFAEVHDCFTIAEILAIEDLGFFPKGGGGKATEEGDTQINARISVNTSGGLKAKGHPVGATGVAQAVEAVLQLRGEAGKRQVDKAGVGLTHNVGGSGATCTVHLFKRMD